MPGDRGMGDCVDLPRGLVLTIESTKISLVKQDEWDTAADSSHLEYLDVWSCVSEDANSRALGVP